MTDHQIQAAMDNIPATIAALDRRQCPVCQVALTIRQDLPPTRGAHTSTPLMACTDHGLWEVVTLQMPGFIVAPGQAPIMDPIPDEADNMRSVGWYANEHALTTFFRPDTADRWRAGGVPFDQARADGDI